MFFSKKYLTLKTLLYIFAQKWACVYNSCNSYNFYRFPVPISWTSSMADTDSEMPVRVILEGKN